MTRDNSCKVISIYSPSYEEEKPFYSLNLGACLSDILHKRILLLDMDTSYENILRSLKLEKKISSQEIVIRSGIGLDFLNLGDLGREELGQLKENYDYILINLPLAPQDLTYHIFSMSDSIHIFISSLKKNLEEGYSLLERLLEHKPDCSNNKLKLVVSRSTTFDALSREEIEWLLRRNVDFFIPELNMMENFIDHDGVPITLKQEVSGYSKKLRYIAKFEADKLVGLALGSGAAFGLAHIGVLKVLEEAELPIDMISGSSMGAVIASLWGLGYRSSEIVRFAEQLKSKLNIMRLLDFTIPISGILAGNRLKSFLKVFLGEKTFEDLKIPVKIMVYDLANRETLSIDKGLLLDAVYKSIAVPGIFKPVIERDRVIIDGGVSEPVPVNVLLGNGVKKIIAVNVLPDPGDMYRRKIIIERNTQAEKGLIEKGPFYKKIFFFIRTYFKKIFDPNIFDVIVTSMQSMEYMLSKDSCSKASVCLSPIVPDSDSIDFHRVKDFIKEGEEEARSHLEEIKSLGL
ncbi:MAG: patatin-like phospholipase family protein [Candidatus Omnitrophota bacterium]